MGCDIHAFLEYRFEDRIRGWQWWETLAQNVGVSRDYRLFALLAGVRNNPEYQVTPIVPPRGIPTDVSEHVSAAASEWGPDGHSHSFLVVEELQAAQIAYGKIYGYKVDYLPRESAVPPGMRLLHYEGLAAVVQADRRSRIGPNLDLSAIIAYLRIYEAQSYRTRMVFWFDN